MKLGFSVNQCDSDGDNWDKCIILHINENIMLRFSNTDEWVVFAENMLKMVAEINENVENN